MAIMVSVVLHSSHRPRNSLLPPIISVCLFDQNDDCCHHQFFTHRLISLFVIVMKGFRSILICAIIDSFRRRGLAKAFVVHRPIVLPHFSSFAFRTNRCISWLTIPQRCRSCTSIISAPLFQSHSEQPAWLAGNVEEDFRKLECAIKLSQAEFKLEQAERREILEMMAKQRYSIRQTTKETFFFPTLVSITITLVFKLLLPASFIQTIRKACSLHFWALVVGAPITLLMAMKQSRGKNDSSDALQQSRFSWRKRQKSKRSCDNYVLCLAEQWSNAVLGMALFGWAIDPAWQGTVQTMTHLAASMSLRQFPLLWHKFRHDSKPTALSRWHWALNVFCAGLCPVWFSAMAVAEIAYKRSWANILLLYGPLLMGSLAALIRWPPPRNKAHPFLRNVKMLLTLSYLLTIASPLIRRPFLSVPLSRPSWQSVCTALATLASLTLPIGHIIAFGRLVHIRYMDDVPLSSSIHHFRNNISETQRREWRWRFHWRDPLRINDAMNEVRSNIFRLLLVRGSVEEQVDRERRSNRLGEIERRKMNILQIVERERGYVQDRSFYNSTQWKENAMDQVKKVHKRYYDAGKDIDALGQAVYKTFDIGLGFEFAFDLFDPANKEPPKVTTRLLQARAARSAIAKARELYRNENISLQLKGIEDPMLRERKKNQLMRERDEQMHHMREKLLELIPTDMPLNFRSEYFSLNRNSTKQGSSIWTLKESPRSQLVDEEVDYLNPGGIPDLSCSPLKTSSKKYNTTQTDKNASSTIESSLGSGKKSSQPGTRNYVNPYAMNRTFDSTFTGDEDPSEAHTMC